MTPTSDTPQSVVSPAELNEITHLIETHDVAGAVGKLHAQVHDLDKNQYHELLLQLAKQNLADRQQQKEKDLPVLHLTNSANGIEGLQIADGKRSVTFCEGSEQDSNRTEPAAKTQATPATESPNAKEGLFYFFNEVNHDSVLNLTQQLESWTADPKNKNAPVRIVMNSPGGNVMDGFSIMDEIARVRQNGHHVKIEDYGMAASAAGWIMQAADTRAIGANSWMLIHEGSSSTSGKLSSMGQDLRVSRELQDQFVQVLAARSHLTPDEIHKHIDNGTDWWIPAATAKTLGLVDVVEPVPEFKPGE